MTTSLLTGLRTVISEFFVELEENVVAKKDGPDLFMVKFAAGKMTDEQLMAWAVTTILPHTADIESRKPSVLIKLGNAIFIGLPREKITYFSNIIMKQPKEELNILFSFFDSIVGLAEAYKKIQ